MNNVSESRSYVSLPCGNCYQYPFEARFKTARFFRCGRCGRVAAECRRCAALGGTLVDMCATCSIRDETGVC